MKKLIALLLVLVPFYAHSQEVIRVSKLLSCAPTDYFFNFLQQDGYTRYSKSTATQEGNPFSVVTLWVNRSKELFIVESLNNGMSCVLSYSENFEVRYETF